MKCNFRIIAFCCIGCACLLGLSCNESLPVYSPPTNILALRVSTIEQLSDRAAPPPSRQAVRIVFTGQNIHDEVFQDSIDIKGSVRIWWKRKPQRFRTMYLAEANFKEKNLISSGKLLLVPGQQITLETIWNLKSDDSVYLPNDMNYRNLRSRPFCGPNLKCADPEEFIVEAAASIYNRIGYISAPPASFVFIAKTCYLCGQGPYCPPPQGGCGSQVP